MCCIEVKLCTCIIITQYYTILYNGCTCYIALHMYNIIFILALISPPLVLHTEVYYTIAIPYIQGYQYAPKYTHGTYVYTLCMHAVMLQAQAYKTAIEKWGSCIMYQEERAPLILVKESPRNLSSCPDGLSPS